MEIPIFIRSKLSARALTLANPLAWTRPLARATLLTFSSLAASSLALAAPDPAPNPNSHASTNPSKDITPREVQTADTAPENTTEDIAAAETAPPVETPPAPTSKRNSMQEGAPDQMVQARNDYYQRMTVPVTIEGRGPFHFMIDTGSQATIVTRGLTERLALEHVGQAVVVGMGSKKEVDLYGLSGLEFAERLFDNIEAPVLEARNVGADGILGLDSLQDLRVMINFRDQTIAVNDAEHLGGNRGYEIIVRARRSHGRLIITQAKIDGVRTAVIVDTGAQSSFGNLALRRRLRTNNRESVTTQDVHGSEIIGDRNTARRIRIQGLSLDNLSITFADSPAFEALDLHERPALILGMRDLRLFDRVAIDFATRRVLFDVPSGSIKRQSVHQKFYPTRLQ